MPISLPWCSLTCSLLILALTLTGCHKPALTPLSGTDSLPPSSSQSDCGPRALWLVCQRLGIQADLDTLHRQAGTTDGGTSLEGLAKAAKANGLKAEGVQMDGNALARLDRPALAWVDRDHYHPHLRRQQPHHQRHRPPEPAMDFQLQRFQRTDPDQLAGGGRQ